MKATLRFLRGLQGIRRGFVAEWAVTIILLLFGTTSLLQAFVIPSGSMEGTLLVGDHLLVNKLTYAPATDEVAQHMLPYRDVQRGDVIVFHYPLDPNRTLVKRAIGIPGDHVRLIGKQLVLNGVKMAEPYAVHIAGNFDPYRDNFPQGTSMYQLRPSATEMLREHVVAGELAVPPGYIFAMGDNRENSDDSRFWGLVPRENIIGTPFLIYWSFDAPEADLMNENIGIDHVVDVAVHFFSKTRWSRTLSIVRPYPLGSK